MNNEKFKEILADFGDYCLIDNLSCKRLIELISKDYEELIALRDKIEYEITNEKLYAEDTQILDHALDNTELLVKILNLQREDMQDNGVYYKVGLELLDKETKQPIEHIEYEEEDIREKALDFYNSLETTEDTAKYIYECTENDEELLDCQGYKEKETIGSTNFGIKRGK